LSDLSAAQIASERDLLANNLPRLNTATPDNGGRLAPALSAGFDGSLCQAPNAESWRVGFIVIGFAATLGGTSDLDWKY
jgi:hypothetical protein